MKFLVSFLSSGIDVNHEEMTEPCLKRTEVKIETGQKPRDALIEVSLETTEAFLAKIEADCEEGGRSEASASP
jgi:hypothetical protein